MIISCPNCAHAIDVPGVRKKATIKRRAGDHPKFLRFVASHPCCIPGCETPNDRVEAHHYGKRGKGQKCSDRQTVPLCNHHHHGVIHGIGHDAGCVFGSRAEDRTFFDGVAKVLWGRFGG